MRALLVFILAIIPFLAFSGGERKYPVSDIPEELRKGMDAVVREDVEEYTLIDYGRATEKRKIVATIFNERGEYFNYETVPYSQLDKVISFTGVLYDKYGEVIEKLKKSDIKDYAAGGEDVGDNMYKFARLKAKYFPYTVEFVYETETTNMIFYPIKRFGTIKDYAIQYASLEVRMPLGDDLRYKESNMPVSVDRSSDTKHEIYKWEVQNVRPLEAEYFGPASKDYVPTVYTAPGKMITQGYEGDFTSWENLGKFQWKLNEGRQELPPETIVKVKNLISGVSDEREKIRLIYEYLQENTRYVSIQLGLGGWQPFPANEVAEKGYGDCKALSNYTIAMLKEAGITSYYTLINVDQKILTDFPSRQFNHVIVCVPMKSDTIWLECTSQKNPFGFLGDFSGDKDVLIVTENGGKLGHSKVLSKDENKKVNNGTVVIDPLGNATAKINGRYSGIFFDRYSYLIGKSVEDQKKALYKRIDIPSFNIEDYKLSQEKSMVPHVDLDLNLTLKKYASVSGKRMFFRPNVSNRYDIVLKKDEERKTDIVMDVAYTDVDSIVFKIPEGFSVEFLPEAQNLETDFGTFEVNFQSDGNQIIYRRRLVIEKGRYSPDKYSEFVDFFKKITKSDKAKVVMVNAT